ncbi:MAG: thioredoxin family protein [Betaproteobacteria bacterium]
MGLDARFVEVEPLHADIDAQNGAMLLEFGAPWCEHCEAAQPMIALAFAAHPQVRHIRIEDGRGRRLGRSFGVKLWPTLIFLREGKEVSRLVRPLDSNLIEQALTLIDSQ